MPVLKVYKNGVWENVSGITNGGNADTLDGKHADEFVLTSDIPTSLPNPNALTINGTSYDGSEAKEVFIPHVSSIGISELNGQTNVAIKFEESEDLEKVQFIPYVTVDRTLTVEGAAADAKAVGDAISDLESNKLDTSSLNDAINTALTQAKASGEFDGADGSSIFYTTSTGSVSIDNDRDFIINWLETNGKLVKVNDLIVSNIVSNDAKLYIVKSVDAEYCYCDLVAELNGTDGVSATHSWNGTTLTVTSASGTSSADLKGEKGTSVTVSSVSESTADGGNNVVTFSDGKTLTVKNGKDGADGDDYIITEADKIEIAEAAALKVPFAKAPTEPTFANGIPEMTDQSKVYVNMETGTFWQYKENSTTREVSVDVDSGYSYPADSRLGSDGSEQYSPTAYTGYTVSPFIDLLAYPVPFTLHLEGGTFITEVLDNYTRFYTYTDDKDMINGGNTIQNTIDTCLNVSDSNVVIDSNGNGTIHFDEAPTTNTGDYIRYIRFCGKVSGTPHVYVTYETSSSKEVTVTEEVDANIIADSRMGSDGSVQTNVAYAGYAATNNYIDLKAYPVPFTLHFENFNVLPTAQSTYTRMAMYDSNKTLIASSGLVASSVDSYLNVSDSNVNSTDDGVGSIPFVEEVSCGGAYPNTSPQYIRVSGLCSDASAAKIYVTYKSFTTGADWCDTGIPYAPNVTEEDKQQLINDIVARIDSQLLAMIGTGEVTV